MLLCQFEKTPPPERVIEETPITFKARKKVEKVEKYKEVLRGRIQECTCHRRQSVF